MDIIPIHTGKWIDRDYDFLRGSSWILTVTDTNLLIAGTSVLVTLLAGGFWSIIALTYHSSITRRRQPDVVDLQHRVICRNNSTPIASFLDAFWVYWTWKSWTLVPPRKRPRRATRLCSRTIWFMLVVLTIFGAFTALATLVAKIPVPPYRSSDVVIANSLQAGFCGVPIFDNSLSANSGFDIKQARDTRAATAYSRNCYSPTTSLASSTSCSLYTVRSLAYTSDATECPFGDLSSPFADSLCSYHGNNQAHRVTTAKLDSHHDFGINAPKDDRIQLVARMICSPLSQYGYTSSAEENLARANASVQVTNYNYGGTPNIQDYTYQYDPAARYDNVPFSITSVHHPAHCAD